jgi:cold shock CspA family protein
MASGRIIKWVTDRGFGFIQEDGSRGNDGDFVHISAMPDAEAPRIGQRFDFDRVTGIDGRTKAVNVREVTTWGEAAYL